MKKVTFVIIAAIVVLTSLVAAAQNRVLGRTDIPFRFTAHGKTFEAGTYELCQISPQIIRLQRVNTADGVTLLSSQNIAETGPTQLVFSNGGDSYILASVTAPSYRISLRTRDELAKLAVRTIAVQSSH